MQNIYLLYTECGSKIFTILFICNFTTGEEIQFFNEHVIQK